MPEGHLPQGNAPDAPQVVFYVLQQDCSLQEAACNVAAHFSNTRKALWLYTDSQQQAGDMDKLLWTFAETEFVPHALAGEAGGGEVQVHICWPQNPAVDGVTVLNIAEQIPPVATAQRILELVLPAAAEKTAARERFRLYRKQGLKPQHIEVASLDMVQ